VPLVRGRRLDRRPESYLYVALVLFSSGAGALIAAFL
jgi:hypothetical protein